MNELDTIKNPVRDHLAEFEKKFRASMKSSVPLLDIITRYILKRKGKQIRPLLVFLTADLCGKVTDSTHNAAAMIELLHTATLVHDDVVDDSYKRRGFFSINALWKNKVAVLVGDYLLSKGLLLSLDNDEFELLKILSGATRDMSEGELLQIEKARRLDIREEIYFEIIRKKTASLIACCCASGALSSGAGKEVVEKFKHFGENLGMAFQIKDDLFDYQSSNMTGKPPGLDIREKKMTLPLIYTLGKSSFITKRRIINIVKNHGKNKEKVKWVIDMVRESGGVDYAREMMTGYHKKAVELLMEFEENDTRTALMQLADYTINRNK